MLKKFLAGCCLAAGFIASAQAQSYQLAVRGSGPASVFQLPPYPGLPGIEGSGPLEFSWQMSLLDPDVSRGTGRSDVSAMADIELVLRLNGQLHYIPLQGLVHAAVYASGDPAVHVFDFSVRIGYSPGFAGLFEQSGRFAADDLPLDALAPAGKGWGNGQTGQGFFSADYVYRNEEFTAGMGYAYGGLTNFSYVLAVPEPATCGMLFAGLGLLAVRGRRRQDTLSA